VLLDEYLKQVGFIKKDTKTSYVEVDEHEDLEERIEDFINGDKEEDGPVAEYKGYDIYFDRESSRYQTMLGDLSASSIDGLETRIDAKIKLDARIGDIKNKIKNFKSAEGAEGMNESIKTMDYKGYIIEYPHVDNQWYSARAKKGVGYLKSDTLNGIKKAINTDIAKPKYDK